MPSPFPILTHPVSRECLWKKTQIEKKINSSIWYKWSCSGFFKCLWIWYYVYIYIWCLQIYLDWNKMQTKLDTNFLKKYSWNETPENFINRCFKKHVVNIHNWLAYLNTWKEISDCSPSVSWLGNRIGQN